MLGKAKVVVVVTAEAAVMDREAHMDKARVEATAAQAPVDAAALQVKAARALLARQVRGTILREATPAELAEAKALVKAKEAAASMGPPAPPRAKVIME